MLVSDFKKVIGDVESQIDDLSNDSNFNMDEISFDNVVNYSEIETLEMNLEVDNKGTVNEEVEGQVEEEDLEEPVDQEVEESEEKDKELVDESNQNKETEILIDTDNEE